MFPFQRSCELSFKISDEGDQNNEPTNLEDQIMLENNLFLGFNNNISNVSINPERGRGRGRGRRSSSSLAGSSSSTNNTIANNDEVEKRILHREYERLRRQEMANLFNSLRQTLPVELIQGKRSISDDVREAINYIQDLKKNVKELEEKRDELRKSVEPPSSSSGNDGGLRDQSCVVIRQSVVGLEIEISVGFEHQQFLLSTALQIIVDEGLEVVTCTSTKFNDKLLHILQCQVQNATNMDVSRLQKRLRDLLR